MLDSSSSWLVSASTQFDSNTMHTTIRLSIHTPSCRFCRVSWSRRRHLIFSARCVSTVINYSIATLLGRSIWPQMSTKHLFTHTDMNQSWSKVSMRSLENHHLLRVGVCSELASPIWLTIVALSWLCFWEHPLLNPIFLCYVGRRTSFVRHCPISALREFCRRSNILLLNNFLSPISKTCPCCLPPELTFLDEP